MAKAKEHEHILNHNLVVLGLQSWVQLTTEKLESFAKLPKITCSLFTGSSWQKMIPLFGNFQTGTESTSCLIYIYIYHYISISISNTAYMDTCLASRTASLRGLKSLSHDLPCCNPKHSSATGSLECLKRAWWEWHQPETAGWQGVEATRFGSVVVLLGASYYKKQVGGPWVRWKRWRIWRPKGLRSPRRDLAKWLRAWQNKRAIHVLLITISVYGYGKMVIDSHKSNNLKYGAGWVTKHWEATFGTVAAILNYHSQPQSCPNSSSLGSSPLSRMSEIRSGNPTKPPRFLVPGSHWDDNDEHYNTRIWLPWEPTGMQRLQRSIMKQFMLHMFGVLWKCMTVGHWQCECIYTCVKHKRYLKTGWESQPCLAQPTTQLSCLET